MKKQVVTVATAMLLATAAHAGSTWSFESTSPLWACLIECSSASADDLGACLESCGAAHDSDTPTTRAAADKLRCQASLMRMEAAQFTCHSRCLTDEDAGDIAGCVDTCNSRYAVRVDLVMHTARCESMRDQ